jgi:hypothetical protein
MKRSLKNASIELDEKRIETPALNPKYTAFGDDTLAPRTSWTINTRAGIED